VIANKINSKNGLIMTKHFSMGMLVIVLLSACNEETSNSNNNSDNQQTDVISDGSAESTTLTITATASADDGQGNIAENVLDNNFDTRWSAQSIDDVNPSETYSLDGVQLAFYKGDERSSQFSLEVSTDNEQWETVLTNISSSGESTLLERFSFNQAVDARYLRYTGEGNSAGSGWNSITKFVVTLTGSNSIENNQTDNTLYPTLAPAQNFDLTQWNLSVPIDNEQGEGYAKATTITVAALNNDYQLDDYFWTADDGGMVFKVYIDGARTSENTTYTRTELREMLRGEDTSMPTQGVNGNNWVFSSVPQVLQNKAGAVDGNMKATLAVNHVTTTGKSNYVGRVIVGQIHAASDEPIRLYYRLLPGHSKGAIYFAHEPSNGNDEQWYEMIGSRSSSADEPENGIELNEKFNYEIDIAGDLMTVTITREDGSTIEQEVDMSKSGYSDGYYDKENDDGIDDTEDYMYFKAGVYNQNKLVDENQDNIDDYDAEADDYVQATFYSLSISH